MEMDSIAGCLARKEPGVLFLILTDLRALSELLKVLIPKADKHHQATWSLSLSL